MSDKFTPEGIPILNLNTTNTTRYEASRFLDSPDVIATYLAESIKPIISRASFMLWLKSQKKRRK